MNIKEPQYRILKHLGSGAGHHVFKAKDDLNNCIVAMKIEKSAHLGQIEAEISKLKQLQGIPGIPNIYESGKTKDSKSFFTTELLAITLQQIAKENKLQLNQVLAIGQNILEILEQVHKKNIVHLDLKPENIMLLNDNLSIETLIKPGLIKLIDFGLAINVEQKVLNRNVFIGSLRYASRNSHKGDLLGYRDDLESLIYVLIYLKTGHLPWQTLKEPKSQQSEILKIGQMKDYYFTSDALTARFPPQFSSLITYVNKLTTFQMPNYEYLKQLFKEMILPNKPCCSQAVLCESKIFSEYHKKKASSNNENILAAFKQINEDKQMDEEDLYDSDTSLVFVSDKIKSFNQFDAKLIKDIE